MGRARPRVKGIVSTRGACHNRGMDWSQISPKAVATVVIIFGGLFAYLKLTGGSRKSSPRGRSAHNTSASAQAIAQKRASRYINRVQSQQTKLISEQPAVADETSHRVGFQFSGHSWDAYEVLGISSSASDEELDIAYKISLGKVDPQSQEFIRLAYEAIQKKRERS